MTRGRSRKRHQSLRKSTDENDHSQTGQGEEIGTPPAHAQVPEEEDQKSLQKLIQATQVMVDRILV
jgi:hypothetical protein